MEENKIEVKPKNPGRVAWGKKLALVSKQLKEAKNKQIHLIEKDIKIDKETKQTIDYNNIQMWLGLGGLAVGIFALYLQYKPKVEPQITYVNPRPDFGTF